MDVQSLMPIPLDLQPIVFSYLDEYSLGACLSVCEIFKKTITENQELKNKISHFLLTTWGIHPGRVPHQLIQLVGGYKRLGTIPVFQKDVNSYMIPGLERQSRNAIDPKELTGSLLRSNLNCYIICHIKETNVYQNNRPCNRTAYRVMVIFENENKLFCHYDGCSDFCTQIEPFNYFKSINKKQFKNLQNLLNGQEIETELMSCAFLGGMIPFNYKAKLQDPNIPDN